MKERPIIMCMERQARREIRSGTLLASSKQRRKKRRGNTTESRRSISSEVGPWIPETADGVCRHCVVVLQYGSPALRIDAKLTTHDNLFPNAIIHPSLITWSPSLRGYLHIFNRYHELGVVAFHRQSTVVRFTPPAN